MPSPGISSARSKAVTSRQLTSTASTFNDDLMQILLSFKAKLLAANKALYDSQSSQFKNLKDEIKEVSVQAKEFKAENALLKGKSML